MSKVAVIGSGDDLYVVHPLLSGARCQALAESWARGRSRRDRLHASTPVLTTVAVLAGTGGAVAQAGRQSPAALVLLAVCALVAVVTACREASAGWRHDVRVVRRVSRQDAPALTALRDPARSARVHELLWRLAGARQLGHAQDVESLQRSLQEAIEAPLPRPALGVPTSLIHANVLA